MGILGTGMVDMDTVYGQVSRHMVVDTDTVYGQVSRHMVVDTDTVYGQVSRYMVVDMVLRTGVMRLENKKIINLK